jgi:hypothetical protein
MKSALLILCLASAPATLAQTPDPAAWGSDHTGKPVPEFTHGDECLFCHRNDVGPGWQKNAHGLTLRQQQDAPDLLALLKRQPQLAPLAAQVTHILGSRKHIRFLKQSGYGKLDLLSVRADLTKDRTSAKWAGLENPHWQPGRFETRCAGCHATGIDTKTRTFTAIGLDCYTCHGVVDLEHTNDTSKIFLSKKRRSDPLAITSTCAQCHLRGGVSRSTGLPYPNNFVPGDNLFKDFQVDWAKAADEQLNPGDRHVWKNVRDVVLNGSETTCLNCHRVHENSSVRHRRVLASAICQDCHNAEGPKKVLKPYTVHSELCEY